MMSSERFRFLAENEFRWPHPIFCWSKVEWPWFNDSSCVCWVCVCGYLMIPCLHFTYPRMSQPLRRWLGRNQQQVDGAILVCTCWSNAWYTHTHTVLKVLVHRLRTCRGLFCSDSTCCLFSRHIHWYTCYDSRLFALFACNWYIYI